MSTFTNLRSAFVEPASGDLDVWGLRLYAGEPVKLAVESCSILRSRDEDDHRNVTSIGSVAAPGLFITCTSAGGYGLATVTVMVVQLVVTAAANMVD